LINGQAAGPQEAHDLLCQPIRTAFQRAPTRSKDAVTVIVQPASQQSRRV